MLKNRINGSNLQLFQFSIHKMWNMCLLLNQLNTKIERKGDFRDLQPPIQQDPAVPLPDVLPSEI